MVPLKEALNQAKTAFSAVWPADQAGVLAREFLAGLVQMSPASIEAHLDDPLPPAIVRRLPKLLSRATAGEPVAYLLGYAPFLQHSFRVTRATLIPRPETEELVHHVLRAWQPARKDVLAVDIGTGSGCMAVSLAAARDPQQVIATDISKRALNVAVTNARALLGTSAEAMTWLRTSLFSRSLQKLVETRTPKQLYLVANLPYLPQSDRRDLHPSVTAFEPALALYADEQGNALILTCLFQLDRFLRNHPDMRCTAWFEFDPPQAETLKTASEFLFSPAHVRILHDENGRSRFLEVRRPTSLDL